MLPGGKVNQKEELGYENIDFSFLAISEEFCR